MEMAVFLETETETVLVHAHTDDGAPVGLKENTALRTVSLRLLPSEIVKAGCITR